MCEFDLSSILREIGMIVCPLNVSISLLLFLTDTDQAINGFLYSNLYVKSYYLNSLMSH